MVCIALICIFFLFLVALLLVAHAIAIMSKKKAVNFQVGDRVKFVRHGGGWPHLMGEEGIVLENPNHRGDVRIKWDKNCLLPDNCHKSCFELVSRKEKPMTEEFKVGDYVKYRGDNKYLIGYQGKIYKVRHEHEDSYIHWFYPKDVANSAIVNKRLKKMNDAEILTLLDTLEMEKTLEKRKEKEMNFKVGDYVEYNDYQGKIIGINENDCRIQWMCTSYEQYIEDISKGALVKLSAEDSAKLEVTLARSEEEISSNELKSSFHIGDTVKYMSSENLSLINHLGIIKAFSIEGDLIVEFKSALGPQGRIFNGLCENSAGYLVKENQVLKCGNSGGK